MKKNYNKYTSFTDRFPYIIVAAVIAVAIIFVLIFRAKFTTLFSSSTASAGQTQSSVQQTTGTQQYPMLISSPANNHVYSFVNPNETVPIKIDLKEDISNTNYKLNLDLGDGSIIKTLTSSPYAYNWNPGIAGDYSIVATLVDANGNIVSSSNIVKFSVEYTSGTSDTSSSVPSGSTTTTIDNSVTINLQISEGPVYSPGDGIYYYRVEAIITGDPLPKVVFSKDDSKGVWGKTIAQINLQKGQFYILTATASNVNDKQTATITLIAPK